MTTTTTTTNLTSSKEEAEEKKEPTNEIFHHRHHLSILNNIWRALANKKKYMKNNLFIPEGIYIE
jgi:hypothetical protein